MTLKVSRKLFISRQSVLTMVVAILISPSHYLTIGLKEENAEVLLEPVFSVSAKGKSKANVSIQAAISVTCVETTSSASSERIGRDKGAMGKSRSSNWLALLIRESLGFSNHSIPIVA